VEAATSDPSRLAGRFAFLIYGFLLGFALCAALHAVKG
jgi:tetrahydromethanopterin S-methyltransferase subunit B